MELGLVCALILAVTPLLERLRDAVSPNTLVTLPATLLFSVYVGTIARRARLTRAAMGLTWRGWRHSVWEALGVAALGILGATLLKAACIAWSPAMRGVALLHPLEGLHEARAPWASWAWRGSAR